MINQLKHFIINCWKFRKELSNYRTFDYSDSLMMFRKTLEELRNTLIEGFEVSNYRFLKVEKMNQAIFILKQFENDNFIELAEEELGIDLDLYMSQGFGNIKSEERKVFNYAHQLEKQYWNKLMTILEGRQPTQLNILKNEFYSFDGTDMKSWWD